MAIWRIQWTLVHRGAPPLSRYTRVLRAAHGRVYSTLHSRFESLIVHELWLTLHLLFSLVWCWFRSNLRLFNTRQASVSLRCWHTERFFAEHLTIETLAIFPSSLYLPSTRLDPLMNKLLFSSLMIRGLRLSVLKTLLKRVLHVLRRTFLGQLLRILLHHLMAYLGQSCLSRPRPSVSQTPCTASWCQPDRLLYGLPKDRLCLSSGLYGFETWVHVGLSGYLCFRIYETLFIDTYNPFLLH